MVWYHYRDREYKNNVKTDVDIISPRYTVLNEIPAKEKEVETIHQLFNSTITEVITDKNQTLVNGGQGQYFILRGMRSISGTKPIWCYQIV